MGDGDGVAVSPMAATHDEHREFWSSHAVRTLHWFTHDGDWLTHDGDNERLTGWSSDAMPVVRHASEHWQPWNELVDNSCAPFVRWFSGGLLNAAFNEIDRHVLCGHGNATAFVSDPTDGRLCLRNLLVESVLAAMVLTKLCTRSSSRVALYLPNGFDAVSWASASKRIGCPHVAISGGTASRAVAERLDDTGAAVLVTGASLLPAASEARRLATTAMPVGLLLPPSATPVEGWQLAIKALGEARATLFASHLDAGVTQLDDSPEALERHMPVLWARMPPLPLDACHPLLILYTSGSTGRPKGVVHTHGGYQVGLCVTSRVVLELQSDSDVLLVLATPGWITGQSYMIAASLLCRTPSVLLEGSPVSPPARFAAAIARHGTTVMKSGSTMMRVLMAAPDAASMLATHDLSTLRLGCFCAEPLPAQIHDFAQRHLHATFINAYWATEHGGMIFGRNDGRDARCDPSTLRADAHSWPLAWVQPVVRVQEAEGLRGWRDSADGESGDLGLCGLLTPYMALTVWSAANFGNAEWRGDEERWRRYFVAGLGYAQGDAAVRHADGSFSFPGRSDEDYMNIAGHRIGAAEVESALLADCDCDAEAALVDCAVVGLPDELSGTAACAFVVLRNAGGQEGGNRDAPGVTLSEADERRLCQQVQERLGWAAVPTRFVVVPTLPKTHSGKYARALLRAATAAAEAGGTAIGDENLLTAVANPECVQDVVRALVLLEGTSSALPTLRNRTDADDSAAAVEPDGARQLLRAIWHRVLRLPPSVEGNVAQYDATPFGALGGASLAATQAIMLASRQGLAVGCDSAALERLSIDQIVQRVTTVSSGALAVLPDHAGGRQDGDAGQDGGGGEGAAELPIDAPASSGTALIPIRIGGYHKAATGAAPTHLVILERDGRSPAMHLRNHGFIAACAAGELARARQQYADGHYAPHAVDKFGSTALMWAASFGRLEVARWLVHDVGVNVDARNKQGRTALMFATKYGQCALAAFLLSEGRADVTIRMRDESSAFDWAVFGGDRPTMDLLAAHPDVDINGMNRHGCAAVQWAAAAGNLETVKWLQAKGVDLAHVNGAHHGAVEKAAWRGHDELLRWLLLAEEGPRLLDQLRVRDAEGRSVVDLCRLGGREATASWLEPLVAEQMQLTMAREE